jgi:hypothetical protein
LNATDQIVRQMSDDRMALRIEIARKDALIEALLACYRLFKHGPKTGTDRHNALIEGGGPCNCVNCQAAARVDVLLSEDSPS